MRILVLAATEKELEYCLNHFQSIGMGDLVQFRTIGVGAITASYHTQLYIGQLRPDMVIMGGIAGCFDKKITLGTTFLVRSEIQATVGVEENGVWKDVFDMGWVKKNEPPYQNGYLVNPLLEKFQKLDLPIADSIAVDEITTNMDRQKAYVEKYHPLLESMEGAAFHFVCLQMDIPFLQIRTVSNYIGERDKSRWDFATALTNLNRCMIEIINHFVGQRNI